MWAGWSRCWREYTWIARRCPVQLLKSSVIRTWGNSTLPYRSDRQAVHVTTSCFLQECWNLVRTRKSGNVIVTLELLFCFFLLSYMLVDNFQRGIFKWPLVFGWSALPDEYIKKHNMTISDPIRYLNIQFSESYFIIISAAGSFTYFIVQMSSYGWRSFLHRQKLLLWARCLWSWPGCVGWGEHGDFF